MRCKLKRRRWWAVVWVCGLSLFGVWTALEAQLQKPGGSMGGRAASGPVAEVPVSSHDLGLLRSKGALYQHDFLILNTGNDVLEIREVIVG